MNGIEGEGASGAGKVAKRGNAVGHVRAGGMGAIVRSQETADKIQAMRRDGKLWSAIALHFGCGQETICKWAREGYPIGIRPVDPVFAHEVEYAWMRKRDTETATEFDKRLGKKMRLAAAEIQRIRRVGGLTRQICGVGDDDAAQWRRVALVSDEAMRKAMAAFYANRLRVAA